MSYTFVKVQSKSQSDGKQQQGYWLFRPKTEEQILEHWNKYASAVIKDGARKLVRRAFDGWRTGHYTNDFERAVAFRREMIGEDLSTAMSSLEADALNVRIDTFRDGVQIHLNHGIQVVIIDSRYSIIEKVVEREVLTFPDEDKPTMNDVRFIVWDGGEHTYAKIGSLDVIDKDGNQKWNTRQEAEAAARWYIEKYW